TPGRSSLMPTRITLICCWPGIDATEDRWGMAQAVVSIMESGAATSLLLPRRSVISRIWKMRMGRPRRRWTVISATPAPDEWERPSVGRRDDDVLALAQFAPGLDRGGRDAAPAGRARGHLALSLSEVRSHGPVAQAVPRDRLVTSPRLRVAVGVLEVALDAANHERLRHLGRLGRVWPGRPVVTNEHRRLLQRPLGVPLLFIVEGLAKLGLELLEGYEWFHGCLQALVVVRSQASSAA